MNEHPSCRVLFAARIRFYSPAGLTLRENKGIIIADNSFAIKPDKSICS